MGDQVKALIRVAVAAAVGVAVWKAVASLRRGTPATRRAGRADQTTGEGRPIVEEWGEESFPASDPPQSW